MVWTRWIFMLVLMFVLYTECVATSDSSKSSEDDATDLNNGTRSKRLALHPNTWSYSLWPGAVVPYEVSNQFTTAERNIIYSAMTAFHQYTCIRFRARTNNDRYYVSIQKYMNTESCFSYIGRQTSNQFRTWQGNYATYTRLDGACLRYNGRGTAMHELMHAIGFFHEHQRDDRDYRINYYVQNYNYRILPRSQSYYMGSYDRTSIMHYNFPGISYDRSFFSNQDIWRINTLYRCRVSRRGPLPPDPEEDPTNFVGDNNEIDMDFPAGPEGPDSYPQLPEPSFVADEFDALVANRAPPRRTDTNGISRRKFRKH